MFLYYQERPALGSRIQIGLVTDSADEPAELFQSLWMELLQFERRCSRFLPESELSQFNRAAGVRRLISPEFQDVLQAAVRMAQWTKGQFNPFVLPALQRSGYQRSLVAGRQQDMVDDHSAKAVVTADRLEVGEGWATIPYGTAIDLGGCGKGYIGDVLAARLQGAGLAGYWLGIGGDVIVSGTTDKGEDWRVFLQPEPGRPIRVGEVRQPAGRKRPFAIATSTTLVRKGTFQGKRWHHIIDPVTGRPAESDLTVMTICRDSLLEADVLASCGIIVGSAVLTAFFDQYKIRDAAWIRQRGRRLYTVGTAVKPYHPWTAVP